MSEQKGEIELKDLQQKPEVEQLTPEQAETVKGGLTNILDSATSRSTLSGTVRP